MLPAFNCSAEGDPLMRKRKSHIHMEEEIKLGVLQCNDPDFLYL